MLNVQGNQKHVILHYYEHTSWIQYYPTQLHRDTAASTCWQPYSNHHVWIIEERVERTRLQKHKTRVSAQHSGGSNCRSVCVYHTILYSQAIHYRPVKVSQSMAPPAYLRHVNMVEMFCWISAAVFFWRIGVATQTLPPHQCCVVFFSRISLLFKLLQHLPLYNLWVCEHLYWHIFIKALQLYTIVSSSHNVPGYKNQERETSDSAHDIN